MGVGGLGWWVMLVEKKGWGRAVPRPRGTGGRHPCYSNTGVTVGGGRESRGSKPFHYIFELPVDIQSRRRRTGTETQSAELRHGHGRDYTHMPPRFPCCLSLAA